MIDFVEELLLAWGQDRVSPNQEVGIASPLGQIDEPGASVGGSRCLSLAEQYIASDRQVLVVEQALRDIEQGCGWHGRQMSALAEVRYARQPPLPLVAQWQRLGMSRDVYRARLDRLHVEVAARWPALNELLDQLATTSQAAQARQSWMTKVQRAARKAEKAKVARSSDQGRYEERRRLRAITRQRDALYRSSGWFQRSNRIGTGLSKHPASGVYRRFTPCPLE